MDDFITTLLNLKESKALNVEILPSEPSCIVIASGRRVTNTTDFLIVNEFRD